MGTLWVLIFVTSADAQIKRVNDRVAPLVEDEAQKRWGEFASSRTADYCMDFTIEHAPRKGKSVFYSGTIFSSNKGAASYTRIRAAKKSSTDTVDFLLVNSPQSQEVWKFEDGKAVQVPKEKWQTPLMEGLVYSPFDLLMPYRNWKARYAGAGRIGQAVHYYDLEVPQDFKITENFKDTKIGKIRIALSRDFNAPAAAEVYSTKGELLKTLSLGSVKKIDDLWIMKTAQLRDDLSREKDILRFTYAKMRPIFSKSIFSKDSLGKAPEKPLLEEL